MRERRKKRIRKKNTFAKENKPYASDLYEGNSVVSQEMQWILWLVTGSPECNDIFDMFCFVVLSFVLSSSIHCPFSRSFCLFDSSIPVLAAMNCRKRKKTISTSPKPNDLKHRRSFEWKVKWGKKVTEKSKTSKQKWIQMEQHKAKKIINATNTRSIHMYTCSKTIYVFMHTNTNANSEQKGYGKPNKWLKQNNLLSFLAIASNSVSGNDAFCKAFLLPNHVNL